MSFVADIFGSLLQADAADDATDAQRASAQEANALQRYMYDTTRADYTPYREAGYVALSQLQNLLRSPQAVRKQPGYNFGINEGIRALERGAAARGMTYSGAQGKALQRFGNDYGTTKLDQAYNRLASLAGIGQVGLSGTAAAGQNYANSAGNALMGMGNAQAVAQLLKGSAYSNMAGALGAFGQKAWDSWGKSGGNDFPTLNGSPWGGTADDPWYG